MTTSNEIKIKLSDILKAVNEACNKKCDNVTITEAASFTIEGPGPVHICITEISKTARTKEPKYEIIDNEVFEVLGDYRSNDKTIGLKKQIERFFRLAGKEVKVKIVEVGEFNKLNTKVDDETIRACSGIPSEEMREHLEMYHPRPDRRLLKCLGCGRYFKILQPQTNVCQECYFGMLQNRDCFIAKKR